LEDEAVVNASGGNGSEIPGPKYDIGDRVQLKFTGDDGTVSTVVGIVEDRRRNEGEWEYLIMYVVNGAPFQHWYPEIAL
jgi:hypothetical protein